MVLKMHLATASTEQYSQVDLFKFSDFFSRVHHIIFETVKISVGTFRVPELNHTCFLYYSRVNNYVRYHKELT